MTKRVFSATFGSSTSRASRTWNSPGSLSRFWTALTLPTKRRQRTSSSPSNFTAEPLEDSLNFWGDHFGVQIRIEFAPYNQIFQQLLDTGSAFRRNSDGVNVILLGLEEWATGERHALPWISARKGRSNASGRGRDAFCRTAWKSFT